MKISVYQRHDSIRVVAGEHEAHMGVASYTVRHYPDSRLAYGKETDSRIRRAIIEIDPSAADAGDLPPIRKVSVPGGKLRAKHRDVSGAHSVVPPNCADCGVLLPGPYGTPGVSLSRKDNKTLLCPDCGTKEAMIYFAAHCGFRS